MVCSDAQINRVLSSSPTAAIISAVGSGQILFANNSLLTLIGSTETDIRSQLLSALIADQNTLDTINGSNHASAEVSTIHTNLTQADDAPLAVRLDISAVQYQGKESWLFWITETKDHMAPRTDVSRKLEMLQTFIDNNPSNIQMKDLEGRFLMVNPAFERLHNLPADQIIGKTVSTFSNLSLIDNVTEHERRVIESRAVQTEERREPMPDGFFKHRTVTKFPVFDSDNNIIGIGSIGHDITEQRNAEELLQNAIASMSEGFALFDADERLVLCNDNYKKIYSAFAGQIIPGITFDELIQFGTEKNLFPAAFGRAEEFLRERLARFRNPSGPYEYRQANGRWIRSEERKIANGGTLSIRSDITERRHAVEALREREAQLRLVTDSLPVLIAYHDSGEKLLMINKTGAEWHSRPAANIVGMDLAELLGDQYEKIRPQLQRALKGNKVDFETQISYPNGVTRDARIIYVPDIDADGTTAGVFALIEDITLINLTHEHLRQSQKMEALGQVTGGVAHEFNNLLMAITGNLELLLENELQDLPEAREDIKRVLEAAFRGKDLTGRLLSYTGNPFSVPERIDAGEVSHQTVELLRPLLGETIEIDLKTAPDLWPVQVDESEFENAIMNLALNGRDAMPNGGRLTIQCENVALDQSFADRHPYQVTVDDYVRISICDNGTGMTAETAQRAFDPFYTTKGVGKGTGLGLSMVYGFVHRQAQGYVDIETSENKGTTVVLYLPRAVESELSEPIEILEDKLQPPALYRSALLVEDNAELRDLFINMLESLNFNALSVDDAAGALDILSTLEPDGQIDLLLTDVVLPGGINGIDLASRAQGAHPEMKVVLISGYPEADLVEKGLRKNEFALLSKPFRKADLFAVLESQFAQDDSEPHT